MIELIERQYQPERKAYANLYRPAPEPARSHLRPSERRL